jgi:voltage-gated potassium channel Kch
MGYAWTFAYALVDETQPGSIVALSAIPPADYVAGVLQMRYFSFMTLTTVGYGDIVPHSAAARTLAALEAITGQIYLTVLVARLVGLHIVHAAHTSSSRED